jgi:hypothetical protein
VAAVIVRCSLVACALVVAAWLALSLRNNHLQAEGRELLKYGKKPTPAQLAHAESVLEKAQRFNADRGPELGEGLVLAAADRKEQGLRVVEGVLKDEPDNLDAWYYVYIVTPDKRRAQQALAHMRELDPFAATRLRVGRPSS